ncbi:MAG: hypothetical protein AB7J13_03385 [Pyrinomonadaceae bacterium]
MTIFLSAIVFLTCAPTALLDFATPYFRSNPNLRVEDAYKWIYQATQGGEHAAPNRELAKKWLQDEWDSMGDPLPAENTFVSLCPGGEIGRLYLRPFREGGGKLEDLLDAFLASSEEYKGDPAAFLAAWTEFGRRLEAAKIGTIDHKAWKKLDKKMREKKYPAVHHSEPYEKAERPAYRVITRLHAQDLIPY